MTFDEGSIRISDFILFSLLLLNFSFLSPLIYFSILPALVLLCGYLPPMFWGVVESTLSNKVLIF